MSHENFTGNVDFDQVNFTYPTRPENRVSPVPEALLLTTLNFVVLAVGIN